jgi:hypothetical protein
MRKGKDPDSGAGSGSVPLTNGYGSGRPKNMRILWIRIRIPNTDFFTNLNYIQTAVGVKHVTHHVLKGIDRPFGGWVKSRLIRSLLINLTLGNFFSSHFKWISSQDQQKTNRRRLIFL